MISKRHQERYALGDNYTNGDCSFIHCRPYSAASSFRPRRKAEHSAMTADARAIGFVR